MQIFKPVFLIVIFFTISHPSFLAAQETADSSSTSATYTRQFTQVDGHRIAYIDEGKGVPVLLIHGIPTNGLMWRDVIPVLSERFRVIAPDLLNYGHSDMPERADVSINAQRGIMFGLLDALGIRRAHLVAHDIGGGVAQLMAVERPERFDRLVLMDTVSFDSWPIPEFEPLQKPGAEADMALDEFVDMIRGFMPQGVVDKQVMTESVIDIYAKPWSSETGKQAFFRNLRRLNSEYTLAIAEELQQLPHAALIVWGEKDPFQKADYGRRLEQTIPNANLVIIDDVGHWLLEEKPAQISELILDFLEGD
ncbi:alpha/beta hydrolase [Kineobactrum sediminis]|uniref:Alpha/beta hydrolase n=1 Tax=Kineobactrum sediminis TaxID=1905677 RepID=A0A2N5XYQ5_9GAMM|nr:alpha/beta hydrolase [Kineobactrum sediminis]PLW81284.1 alpha/beta hydrolase [Kineobactrum sediminis]